MADRKAPDEDQSETWNELPWRKLEKHVYRIQKRIYRAKQAGKTRAVQKLQKLLMKSEAARLLAVRRVTQDNQGKKTAGVDGVKSVKPKQRLTMATMIHPKFNRRQKPRPARRVWIPKPGKDEKRPLGIPIWAAYCLSFQEMFGITLVTPWVDRTYQSTNILILYHRKGSFAMLSLFPLSSSWLAQGLDDLGSQRNPAGTMSRGSDKLQFALLAPLGNRRDINIQQLSSSFCRVASVASLSSGRSTGTFWTIQRNAVGIANPLDFAGGKCASRACDFPFFIEHTCDLGVGMSGSQFSYTR